MAMSNLNTATLLAQFIPEVHFDGSVVAPNWVRGPQGLQGLKGDTGDVGVHVGPTAPTDPNKHIWINPDVITEEMVPMSYFLEVVGSLMIANNALTAAVSLDKNPISDRTGDDLLFADENGEIFYLD